jgi:DNA gyrase subunit A
MGLEKAPSEDGPGGILESAIRRHHRDQIDGDDRLIAVEETDGSEFDSGSRNGMAIRFNESDVRPMGRTAYGVRGMQLREGDEVVAMGVVSADCSLLTVCEHGYGKRTEIEEYRRQSRGGIGLKDIYTSKRNGPVVGMACVTERHEVFLVTEQGQIIRMKAGDMRPIGRDTQGVKVMDLAEGDRLVSVATLLEVEDDPAA